MTVHTFSSSNSGDTDVAGALEIVAPGALYAVEFSTPEPKTRNRSFSRLRRETALRVRGLTKSEDQETIIINRPDRSTYPDRESVLTSGATPARRNPVEIAGPRPLSGVAGRPLNFTVRGHWNRRGSYAALRHHLPALRS